MSLRLSGLSVARSGKALLSDVTATIPAGAITGLIGPNGAGKSTLLSAMLGLVPASGSVQFDGSDLLAMSRRDRARLVALVEQSASTEERLTVRDVVGLGRIPHEPAWQSSPSTADQVIIETALAQTGMTDFALRRFDTLSGGEQQRVHLARALAQQPRLLLLDEPTSHLDVAAQLQLLSLLRREAAGGMTVLIALHDLNLAARFCDSLLVLANGHRAADGPPGAVLTPALIQNVYGLRARLLPDPATGGQVIVYDAPISIDGPQIPN